MASSIGIKFPFGTSIFCDDIRFELQNKISLIGCYGPELILFQPPPVVLPKFCAHINVRLPLTRLPAIKVNVYNPEEDDPFFTQEICKAEEADFDASEILKAASGIKDAEPHRVLLHPLVFIPFVFAKLGFLKIRLLYGDEIVRIGSIRISHKPQSDSNPANAEAPST